MIETYKLLIICSGVFLYFLVLYSTIQCFNNNRLIITQSKYLHCWRISCALVVCVGATAWSNSTSISPALCWAIFLVLAHPMYIINIANIVTGYTAKQVCDGLKRYFTINKITYHFESLKFTVDGYEAYTFSIDGYENNEGYKTIKVIPARRVGNKFCSIEIAGHGSQELTKSIDNNLLPCMSAMGVKRSYTWGYFGIIGLLLTLGTFYFGLVIL
ncbi:hypothetical protein LP316_05330 [Thalassotalea sp. LPB0316]|uniref:hypothetical protein n=1 Tax=Thalassotalea sp. LPB0316 TaxID=2769490 RepID=UPI0018694887|nr:hypothetical protein [Thalassotalea sp. LPB0316]QOL26723.1 hypothetical protein LP316_05330 [Thalassotalea sp. LPB0316]